MAKTSALLPLLILILVVGIFAFVGLSLYAWSGELAERGRANMEKKNLKFTKEGGLRVGVKEVKDENYADKTQNVLVNVWNNAALPNYKSRLGWNSTQSGAATTAARPSGTSNTRATKTSSASASSSSRPAPTQHLSTQHHESRPSARRTSSTPGGWD